MDTLAIFVVFFLSLIASIFNGVSILYPLLLGLAGFTAISLRRGHPFKSLLRMMVTGSKKSLIVIRIFVLIGAITAVWRACGTIPFIVYYGIEFMNGTFFIVSAFLLCCIVSFLLGTSLGTVGTVGVVLMVMARSGHVDINVAAGAIIAGIYFGDRCSPMSSSAHLIASLTGTKLYVNISNMTKTSILPFALSMIGYIGLSFWNPLTFHDNTIGTEILKSFDINVVVVLPAVLLLLLAAFRVDVKLAMSVSILSGVLIGMLVQHLSPLRILEYIISGYKIDSGSGFAAIIDGGGLYSMLNVSLIVLISSSYSGIFEGTGLLEEIETFIETLSEKISVYPAMIFVSLATSAFSCNQTFAVILTHQFAQKIYSKLRLSNYRLSVDLENTVIVIAPLIPWNTAGAVPAAALSADSGFIPYAFYLFLIPLINLATRRIPIDTDGNGPMS